MLRPPGLPAVLPKLRETSRRLRGGALVTPAQQAVLEAKSALHNWRQDPSNANSRALILANDVVCGHLLELEGRCAALEQEALRRLDR